MPPFNYKKADWKRFESNFKRNTGILYRNPTSIGEIDQLVGQVEEAIYKSAEDSIPRLQVVKRSKPWWSLELTSLRKALNTAFRRFKKNPTPISTPIPALEAKWKAARNTYFHAIRKAKEDHWQEFLANAEGNDIYTALKFTKGFIMSKIPEIRYIDQGVERKAATFDEKCKAFISTLFPTPKEAPQEKEAIQPGPYNWKWPSLQDVEIERAIQHTNSKKAPRNDRIGNAILKKAYASNPAIFNALYKACFNLGYHPPR